MNKRKLSRLMHERVGALKSWKNNYFFRDDFEYVLRGVCFDYTPRGLYIVNFRFPLFEFESFELFGGPHLSYSDRVFDHRGWGFVGKGEMSEEAIVDFVMSFRDVQSAFAPHDKLTELPDFVYYLESRPNFPPSVPPGLLRNANARLIHIAALLLLGQESRAVSLLDDLAPVFNEYPDHPANKRGAAFCNLLQTSLQQGLAAVRTLLDQIRQENLRRLGIAS